MLTVFLNLGNVMMTDVQVHLQESLFLCHHYIHTVAERFKICLWEERQSNYVLKYFWELVN